jgi:hypothetical protein
MWPPLRHQAIVTLFCAPLSLIDRPKAESPERTIRNLAPHPARRPPLKPKGIASKMLAHFSLLG